MKKLLLVAVLLALVLGCGKDYIDRPTAPTPPPPCAPDTVYVDCDDDQE